MHTPHWPAMPALLIAALSALALPAQALDAAKPAPAVASAAASALCEGCGRVVAVTTETRKGKATMLGTVGGAVAGGVLGHQVGGGDGKKVATVGGAVAGGFIGREIEKNLKKHTVWITTVAMKDGSQPRFEAPSDPGLAVGEVVRVENGQLRRLTPAAPAR